MNKLISDGLAFSLALMILTGTTGCSQDLSKAMAMQLIKEKGGFPRKAYVKFAPSRNCGPVREGEGFQKNEFERKIEEMGLALVKSKIVEVPDWGSKRKEWKVIYELTSRGKEKFKLFDENQENVITKLLSSHPSYVFRGIVGEEDIKEITRVEEVADEGERSMVVEYVVVATNPTELGVLDRLLNGQRAFKPGVERREAAEFELVDGAWRLVAIE